MGQTKVLVIEASANRDGRIELRELYEYLKPQVERARPIEAPTQSR